MELSVADGVAKNCLLPVSRQKSKQSPTTITITILLLSPFVTSQPEVCHMILFPQVTIFIKESVLMLLPYKVYNPVHILGGDLHGDTVTLIFHSTLAFSV